MDRRGEVIRRGLGNPQAELSGEAREQDLRVVRTRRDEARRWLWKHSVRDRQRDCGRHAVGGAVGIVKRGGDARWTGLETCGSVWSCPVCSAAVLARRGDELTAAVDAWHEQGGSVAMVTLTMRHGRDDTLASCWDGLTDAWGQASGIASGPRRAKQLAEVAGWVRRVEVTWGQANGWHVHVHALLFLRAPEHATQLGDAMYGAWAARLARHGLTPEREHGVDCRVLDLAEARELVSGYVTKGVYEATSARQAAAELTGGGKLGRGGNLTPWGLLEAAREGNAQAAALWAVWERVSLGRRALTWSRGIREQLGLAEDLADEQLVDDDVDVDQDVTIGTWTRDQWPEVRDSGSGQLAQLLTIVAGAESPDAAYAELWTWAVDIFKMPPPAPGPTIVLPDWLGP